MTKLSDLDPSYPGKKHGKPVVDEREHFYRCAHCGQLVDMRDLAQVMWHEDEGHEPLKFDA
ncbi:hypothetical protein [Mesorhizobium sp. M1329]|uniref:hypothetical protein n=1 Tax=Mesorhizobium sp. M1329 TaxID=2957083 RepID=UPI00333A6FD9